MAADLAFKISPENIIADFGEFESWSNGNSVAPDGWRAVGTAGSIARESTNIKFGTYSMRVISGSSGQYAGEYWYDFLPKSVFRDGIEIGALNYFPGKTFTFGVYVKCSSASKARIYMNDGVASTVYSSYHTGDGTWQLLEVEIQISEGATILKLGCEVASNAITAYFDSAIFVEGENLFTDFRGSTVYLRENEFDPNVTFSVGSFVIPRREGTKIQSVQARSKSLRLKVQIYSTDFPTCRAIFDSIVKAVAGGKKDLWFEDDRVSKVYLTNVPKLEFLANARVYIFEMQFTAEEPFEYYLARLRTKQNISASPTSFQIENNGSVKHFPRFLFLPPAGITLSSITMENLTTGERFNYTTSIPPGGTLFIDGDEIKVLSNGVDGLSYFTGDFIRMALDTNFFRFTGTTGITILVDQWDRFL